MSRGYEGLTTSADREREEFRRAWDLADAPPAALGHTELRCGICNAPWVDLPGGIQGCSKDRNHNELIEIPHEPQVIESDGRGGWQFWKRPKAPEPVGADEGAREALERLSVALSASLQALEAADQACRQSSSGVEQEMTWAAQVGTPIKREFRDGFRRVSAALRSQAETVGDLPADLSLGTLRQELRAMLLLSEAAAKESAE